MKGSTFGRFMLLDISSAMLGRAKKRLSTLSLSDSTQLLRADANILPISSGEITYALMAFVLHLLPNIDLALKEITRILMPGGYFFIVTYEATDLQNDIYNKYFPGYFELDTRRFIPIATLIKRLEQIGFVKINKSKHTFKIVYESVDEVIKVTENKPTSILANYFDNDDFSKKIKQLKFNLQKDFGKRKVYFHSKITLLSMMNPP